MNCLKIKVKFTEVPSNIKVGFKNAITVSDGGYEKGYEQGIVEGKEQGIEIGYNNGYEVGEKEGYDKGYQVGFNENSDFLNLLISRPIDREIELTIPNGIKYLGDNALYGWYKQNTTLGLRKLNLNEVETVGAGALQNNRSLVEVNTQNLTMLSYICFAHCIALPKAYFPNVLVASEGYIFQNCVKLKVLEFDKLETFIGISLQGCSILDTLIIRTPKVCTLTGSIPTTATLFANGTAKIYVPDNLVEQYKVATNWVNHSDIIKPLSEYEGEI